MARSVRIELSLIADKFKAGLSQATKQAQTFAGSVAKASQTQGWKDSSTSLLLLGGSLTLAAGKAISLAANFDAAMSDAGAAMKGAGLSGDELGATMGQMRDLALEAGAKTKYSAQEAAEGITELAKANVSAADITGGALYAALNLAASGNLGVADSAGLVSQAMTQFNLTGAESTHIADLLAAGANKAMGDTSDLAMALKQSGLVAAQFGLSIEDTTGTLSAFASAGLLGSDAGTSFRSMLIHLGNPTKEAAGLMDKLGIAAYDSSGNFAGMESLAGQLQTQLGSLAPAQRDSALATIFGSDAIRAANVLYQNGAAGIKEWTDAVNEQGYAAQLAADKQDNLKGDLEKLSGSFETLAISAGDMSQGPLRGVVQTIDALVQSIPPGLAGGLVLIAGGLGAVALTAGGLMKATTAVTNFVKALKAMDGAAKANLAILALTTVITVATAAFGAHAKAQQEAEQRADELADTLDKETGAITENTRATVANNLAGTEAADQAKALGLSLDVVTDAALGDTAAIEKVNEAIEAHTGVAMGSMNTVDAQGQSLNDLGDAYLQQAQDVKASADSYDKLTTFIGQNSKAVNDAREKNEEAAEANGDQTAALRGTKEATEEATQAVKDENDALSESIDLKLKASGSLISLEASYDDAADAAKKNGKTLDLNTEAGRANMEALNGMASANASWLDAATKNGTGQEEIAKQTQRSRDQFIAAAIAMGKNKEAAAAMADEYGLTIEATQALSNTSSLTQAQLGDLSTMYGLTKEQVMGLSAQTGLADTQIYALATTMGGTTQAASMTSEQFDDLAQKSGLGRDKIDALRLALGLIPPATPAQVEVITNGTAAAKASIDAAAAQRTAVIRVTTSGLAGVRAGIDAAVRAAGGRAFGGLIPLTMATGGALPPKPGVDTIPALLGGRHQVMLDGGEFIVNRWAAKKNFALLQAINSGTNWGRGAPHLPGYATGGQSPWKANPILPAPPSTTAGTVTLDHASVAAIAAAVSTMNVTMDGHRVGAVTAAPVAARQGTLTNLAGRGMR